MLVIKCIKCSVHVNANHFTPGRVRGIAMSVFVCPRAYLKNWMPYFASFCSCYLWPWIGPPAAALRYIM